MVYYLLVVDPSSSVTSCASSGLYERGPSSARAGHGSGAGVAGVTSVDVVEVKGLKIFRAIGAGAGLEDALPIQRTSALLMVAVPSEMSVEELQSFLSPGDALEALRVVFRHEPRGKFFCPSLEGKSEPGSGASGFYTCILLCRSQAHADALYKANHGRLFERKGGDDKGPCCYLAFLEAIVYSREPWELTRSKSDELAEGGARATEESELPEAVIPSTAYEVPSCPVCIERIDVSGTGLVTHSHGWIAEHQDERQPRPPTCTACAVIAATNGNGRTEARRATATLQCECCEKQDELWVCLICGHLGCGRYQERRVTGGFRLRSRDGGGRSTAEHKTETHTVERLHLLAVLADASDEVGILIRYHIWTRGTRVPKEENSLRAFVIFCE
ncbi:BRCA1-associated protein (BRAP2) (Impedes mitogenic signal propagation) (IMP) (RING-type E3 ubiquitin transferase BRAP2) [Durusdinium trenchii]|uniref:BRCA1-associated protein (BRAP2) (Impedes mitogenic signal propagation) (IMP) (RING-type E3 ubiquitin transferase BRAP2) n=1 Tax=Durusdinium trenchii TaxID=1381693 RepID=A0ABP0QZB9_9DINO